MYLHTWLLLRCSKLKEHFFKFLPLDFFFFLADFPPVLVFAGVIITTGSMRHSLTLKKLHRLSNLELEMAVGFNPSAGSKPAPLSKEE